MLTLNIGNSRIAAGWHEGRQLRRVQRAETAAFKNKTSPRAEFLTGIANGNIPDAIGISSVVPAQTPLWEATLKKHFPHSPICRVSHTLHLGIALGMSHPEQVGNDRLAGAVGAADWVGTPCILCDFGTVTTVNLITSRKGFCGGVILPGFGTWFSCLAKSGTQLPHVTPQINFDKKIGETTQEAIQLGACWGYRGLLDEVLRKLAKAAGTRQMPRYCATGGWAETVIQLTQHRFILKPDVILHGIANIVERNR